MIHTDPNAAHATYAPSSAHRWTVCTASATAIAAMERVVPQEEGEAAASGTAAHEEIERVLGCQSGAVVDYSSGSIVAIDPDHPAAYGIALVLDFVRQLPPGRLWIEQRVALTEQIWGRCDVAHWHEESGVLTIVDYKNGFVGVDAEENEQLRIYAAGSIYTHKLPVRWIRYVVVQPNDFRPGPRVKQWHEGAADLFAFAECVAAIPHGPLSFVTGEHCRDCPLFGICDPTRDILRQLGIMMAGGPGGDVEPAQIPLFLACKKPIDHFFEGLNKSGLKKALAGTVPPGMKIVTATKHRAWKDKVAARAAVIAAKGVDALEPPTPAQAEDMGIDVSTLADKPPGGPALAMASDKRPEWKPKTAAEMFAGVPSTVLLQHSGGEK